MVAPKREKMACQRSMTKKKEREKKGGNHVSSKKRENTRDDSRETTIASRSKPYPFIHPPTHLLIHLHLLIEIA